MKVWLLDMLKNTIWPAEAEIVEGVRPDSSTFEAKNAIGVRRQDGARTVLDAYFVGSTAFMSEADALTRLELLRTDFREAFRLARAAMDEAFAAARPPVGGN